MEKQLNERVSHLDIQSLSKCKLKRWGNLQTEELETLYASLKERLSSIPSNEWDDWDKESFKLIGDMMSKRRAEAARQEIARMMELAGMRYGVQRVIHQRKASALKQLNKNNR